MDWQTVEWVDFCFAKGSFASGDWFVEPIPFPHARLAAARVLYCLDVPNRDECPGADLNSGLLSKFTLRPSRDYTCTTCWNRRLLIVDYLLPKVHPVFCPCFGCFVPRLLLYCSTSQTYQNVPKEPFFLMIDENTGDAIWQSRYQNSKWTTELYRLLWRESNQNQRVFISARRAWVIPQERSVNSHSVPEWKSAPGHSSRLGTSRQYSKTSLRLYNGL